MSSKLNTSETTGIVGWCQDKDFSQTYATGCFDIETELGYLKIFSLNLADTNNSFVLQNEVNIEERFNCITWGNSDPTFARNGLIAGGMVDGSLMVWDGHTLLNPDSEQDPLLCNIGLYNEQQFFSLEFNNYKKEWLATGGSDVYIANLENMSEEPDVFCPNTKENEFFITSVSWNKNRSLPHILASGSSDGAVNVWDLKVKRSISSFRDNSGSLNRNTQVSWNPNLPTQIAVTFDDGEEAGLQIWDLRNSKAPVTVFNDSHVGSAVHCLSWSSTNNDHILTGDRNGVVVVWDYKSNEIVKEETLGYEFLTAQWIPKLPSMYYVIGVDGKLNLHTIDQNQVNKISQSHAPKWMKNPTCGTTLGNTVVNFSNSSLDVVKKEIFIPTELTDVVDTWNQLVENDDVDKVCEFEIENSNNEEEKDLWRLLKLGDKSASEMLTAIGFSHDDIVKKTEKFTGISHNHNNKEEEHELESTTKKHRKFEFAQMDEDEAAAFFNQLSSNVQNDNSQEKEHKHKNVTMNCFFNEETQMEEETNSVNVNWDAGAEDLIRRNLFVGNFRGALDCALKCERYAHAFLIAYAKNDDPELMQLAADSFALLIKDPVSNLLQNVINDKVEDIVERYSLARWKEITSFIISNYEAEKGELLSKLSKRLLDDGNASAAQCLALISQDFDLFEELTLNHENKILISERNYFLISTFKKLLVLKQKTGMVFNSEKIQNMLIEVAFMLTEQTHFKLAYTILLELGDHENNNNVLSAMNTIYYLYQPLLQLVFEAPESIIETYQLPSIGRQVAQPEQEPERKAHTPRENKRGRGRWSKGSGGRKPPVVHKTPKTFGRKPMRENASKSTAGYDEAEDTYSLQSDLDLDTMNKKLPIDKRIKSNKFRKGPPPVNTKGVPQPARKAPRVINKPVRSHAGPPKPKQPAPHAPGPVQHKPPKTNHHHHAPPPDRRDSHHSSHDNRLPPPKPGPKKVPAPHAKRPAPRKPTGPHKPAGPGLRKPKGPAPRKPHGPPPGRSVPSHDSKSQSGVPPNRPAPRGPPRNKPPGPPSRTKQPPKTQNPGPRAPPARKPGPPAPGRNAPAPARKTATAPPPKKSGPPPARGPANQNLNQHQSDTLDYDTLFDSLEQAREFLEDIVEPSRLNLYQGYLDALCDQINNNQLQSDVLDNLAQFFDCLCENDSNGAKHYYKTMKKIANSACREWLSVLDLILKSV